MIARNCFIKSIGLVSVCCLAIASLGCGEMTETNENWIGPNGNGKADAVQMLNPATKFSTLEGIAPAPYAFGGPLYEDQWVGYKTILRSGKTLDVNVWARSCEKGAVITAEVYEWRSWSEDFLDGWWVLLKGPIETPEGVEPNERNMMWLNIYEAWDVPKTNNYLVAFKASKCTQYDYDVRSYVQPYYELAACDDAPAMCGHLDPEAQCGYRCKDPVDKRGRCREAREPIPYCDFPEYFWRGDKSRWVPVDGK
ncbi:MAG: hypothetical protein V1754_08490 [Pseudomonadota bacterium]